MFSKKKKMFNFLHCSYDVTSRYYFYSKTYFSNDQLYNFFFFPRMELGTSFLQRTLRDTRCLRETQLFPKKEKKKKVEEL